jgi:hypothetical protein
VRVEQGVADALELYVLSLGQQRHGALDVSAGHLGTRLRVGLQQQDGAPDRGQQDLHVIACRRIRVVIQQRGQHIGIVVVEAGRQVLVHARRFAILLPHGHRFVLAGQKRGGVPERLGDLGDREPAPG